MHMKLASWPSPGKDNRFKIGAKADDNAEAIRKTRFAWAYGWIYIAHMHMFFVGFHGNQFDK